MTPMMRSSGAKIEFCFKNMTQRSMQQPDTMHWTPSATSDLAMHSSGAFIMTFVLTFVLALAFLGLVDPLKHCDDNERRASLEQSARQRPIRRQAPVSLIVYRESCSETQALLPETSAASYSLLEEEDNSAPVRVASVSRDAPAMKAQYVLTDCHKNYGLISRRLVAALGRAVERESGPKSSGDSPFQVPLHSLTLLAFTLSRPSPTCASSLSLTPPTALSA